MLIKFNEMQRTCKNCENKFEITEDDSNFYEKLKVPPPTNCRDCRMQRRLAYRNERRLHRRNCDLCDKSIIAMYPAKVKFPVYCRDCWWGDGWDPLSFGQIYDFSKSFSEQFKELSDKVPHLAIPNTSDNVNCEYVSWTDQSKNCYLMFGSTKCEDVINSELLYKCKNSIDCTNCNEIELSYQCINSKKCYRTIWGINCVGCNDCMFCFDCRNSNNCFLSTNLRTKSYFFLNKQYTKEEWRRKVEEVLGSYKKMEEALSQFKEIIQKTALHRYANFVQCVNSSGNDLFESKNALNCFDSSKLEDCKYVSYGEGIKDCYDCYAIVEKSELCYENLSSTSGAQSIDILGNWGENYRLHSSQYIASSHDCIGCYGLRQKEYCILNKQYPKEEYEQLTEKIIEQMKKNNEYGEFFPIPLSPFGYNESLAFDYFPLSPEEALKRGYPWQEELSGIYGKETLKTEEIPDKIIEVKDTVINEVLRCETCKKNYRVVGKEFSFYRQLNIPIPRKCADCRYYYRLLFRNPRQLWHRSCMCEKGNHLHGGKCKMEFETSYAPNRPEIVYCEKCYQQEVY